MGKGRTAKVRAVDVEETSLTHHLVQNSTRNAGQCPRCGTNNNLEVSGNELKCGNCRTDFKWV